MLKVLKGSRILVDCETGDLHIDLGDGNCKPMGGGSGGPDLTIRCGASIYMAFPNTPGAPDDGIFSVDKTEYEAFRNKLTSGESVSAVLSVDYIYGSVRFTNAYHVAIITANTGESSTGFQIFDRNSTLFLTIADGVVITALRETI